MSVAVRKSFVRRGWVRAFFVSAVIGLGLLVYAVAVEPNRVVVREVTIGEGEVQTRFVLVADIHVGGMVVDADKVGELVTLINAQDPDFVIMPGDFIDGSERRADRSAAANAEIEAGVASLINLKAPAYASLGNHDTMYGRTTVHDLLGIAGVRVLHNGGESRDGFCFVGMADHDTDFPTSEGFNACAEGDTVVALMHSPDSRSLLRSDTALAVAGHTHGGQVNLPVLGRAVTSTACGKPCAYGLIQTEPPLYVTAGIGTSILPIRFRATPEIVVITLNH